MTCQHGRCTRHGIYSCTTKLITPTEHLVFCGQHADEFGFYIQGIIGEGVALHDYLDVEYAPVDRPDLFPAPLKPAIGTIHSLDQSGA